MFPRTQGLRSLEKLTNALRLVDTRHFYHDTALLAFELLDVRLNDTELVDTCTYHEERVVDSCLNLIAQHLLYLLVRRVGRYLALKLLCGEDLREVMSRSVLLVSVDEEVMKSLCDTSCSARLPSSTW